MKKWWPLIFIFLVITSCTSRVSVPAGDCLIQLQQMIRTDIDRARRALKGSTLLMNVVVSRVSEKNILSIQESDSLRVIIDFGSEDTSKLTTGQVVTIEGQVTELSDGFLPTLTLSTARVITETFRYSGKIEKIYTDVNGSWRKYCLFGDHEILPGYQLVVFLSEDKEYQEGDILTVEGKVQCHSGTGFAMLPDIVSSEMLFLNETVDEDIN